MKRYFLWHIKDGKSFGVYDLEKSEFALARRETKIGQGHKKFKIENDEEITIEEDLARRDITINSIAKNVLTNEIIDPYNGIKDIKNKIIRATTVAFKEDPLRAYRVARFAAMLDFEVDEKTISLIKSMRNEIASISCERVFEEFKKALMTDKPSIFFEILRKANILDIHFKEIYNLIGKTQPEQYHKEGDSYVHTMMVLDNSVKFTNKLEIRFSCLMHDLGKSITPIEMLPHHYGHDINGVKVVEEFCKRLKIPNSWKKCGKISAKEHMLGGIFNKMTPKKQVDFITRVEKSALGLDGLKIVVLCDRYRDNILPDDIIFDEIGKQCIEIINGNYIKQKYNEENNKKIGELLRKERIEWIKNLKNKNLKNKK